MVHSLLLFMTHRLRPCALATALCAITVAVHAQSNAAVAKPALRDPLDAQASVPPLRYQSSLGAHPYRGISDAKPVPWREANETVNRIGGWRAYAREAQQLEPAAADKPAGPSAAGDHSGHSGHKAP